MLHERKKKKKRKNASEKQVAVCNHYTCIIMKKRSNSKIVFIDY